ncbi:hypothetical protein XA68_15536 [Ophiocordyceps unilateralis]|uniref:RNA polymerase I-specific transcription initiation factor RRN6-like protein n=1 Tax=Ophiocordyceps unilateralis TaxID=268505 RepID=A0A2A9PLA1_OPHUN|nr:hypothetical protein XA68_15536 [Ophiocordyceps unilateralis]
MTELRRIADTGLTGSLAYLPADNNPEDGPGYHHTTELQADAPNFETVGSSVQLYPACRLATPGFSSQLWRERRSQQRWLLSAHPEAYMGNTVFMEYLKEDMERFKYAEETVNRRPLLAVGSMVDLSNAMYTRVLPLLAVASGQFGEGLRLARIDESQWQWGDDEDTYLQLAVVDSELKEEETVWKSDVVPITQVKAVSFLTPHRIYRWLLVQKCTSTTILEPEYHPMPVEGGVTDDFLHQRLSFVRPNPLVTLGSDQTGGNAHSDVSLNPCGPERHPQLVVVDECGYWTIWNILGTSQADRTTIRLAPYRCGHMSLGLMDRLPSSPAYPAERHGIFHLDFESSRPDDDKPTIRRTDMATPSRYVLIWNAQECEVLDLESKTSLPKPELLSQERGPPDQILDVQQSSVNKAHVFVLTARRLIWLELVESKRGRILISVSHIGTGRDGGMRMSVARASEDNPYTSLVFTYSSKTERLCVHWFGFSLADRLPRWHRHVTQLSTGGDVQQLRVQPAKLVKTPNCGSVGPGSNYFDNGVQFYQVSMLGGNLNVRLCIGAASTNSSLEVTLPTNRIGWSQRQQRKLWKRRRKEFLAHLTDAFVLPDAMDEQSMSSVLKRTVAAEEAESSRELVPASPPREPRPVFLKMDRIMAAMGQLLDLAVSQGECRPPVAVLEAVYDVLRDGQLDGRLPLTTWADVADGLQQPVSDSAADDDIGEAVQRVMDLCDDRTMVTQLQRQQAKEPFNPHLSFSSIKQQLSELWLEPAADKFSQEVQQVRKGWVSEIARDVFLCSHGVMVQDVPLFGHGGSLSDEEGEAMTMPSHQSSSPALPKSSSPASPKSPFSAPPQSSSPAPPSSLDGAFRRLKLLVPSLEPGKLGTVKQSKVLSFWPTERGVGTQDYTSSVKTATEEQFRDARERLQRKEAKRKALADRYKRPAFTRRPGGEATKLPLRPLGVQALSSPPPMMASSQVVGPPRIMTMSQPVLGAFGNRKMRVVKRKGGFR